jgi:hypothetical protein
MHKLPHRIGLRPQRLRLRQQQPRFQPSRRPALRAREVNLRDYRATARLMPLVYDELRVRTAQYPRGKRRDVKSYRDRSANAYRDAQNRVASRPAGIDTGTESFVLSSRVVFPTRSYDFYCCPS